VPFLGVVIEEGKVKIKENKVAGVLKWPIPQCKSSNPELGLSSTLYLS